MWHVRSRSPTWSAHNRIGPLRRAIPSGGCQLSARNSVSRRCRRWQGATVPHQMIPPKLPAQRMNLLEPNRERLPAVGQLVYNWLLAIFIRGSSFDPLTKVASIVTGRRTCRHPALVSRRFAAKREQNRVPGVPPKGGESGTHGNTFHPGLRGTRCVRCSFRLSISRRNPFLTSRRRSLSCSPSRRCSGRSSPNS